MTAPSRDALARQPPVRPAHVPSHLGGALAAVPLAAQCRAVFHPRRDIRRDRLAAGGMDDHLAESAALAGGRDARSGQREGHQPAA